MCSEAGRWPVVFGGERFHWILRALDGFCETCKFVPINHCDDTLTKDGQAGDICALERIGKLMQHELPKPSPSKIAQAVGRTQAQDSDTVTKEAIRICAEFAQATTLLEQRPVEDGRWLFVLTLLALPRSLQMC